MKNRLILGLGLLCISALGGAFVFSREAPEQLTVTLDKPVHFLAPDGTDKVLSPGEYTAKTHDEKSIQLTSVGSGETTILQAETGAHEQQLSAPTPVAVASDEDVVHIVLLLPGGTTLDAIGTLSGVTTRGATMTPLSPQQLAGVKTILPTFPGGGIAPGVPQVGTQLPPQLQSQPGLQKTAPPLVQSGPQLDECVQIVQAGGVRVDLKAQATGPRSVTISWSGLPGTYEVSILAPASVVLTAVQLGPASLKEGSLAQRVPQGETGATAQPQMLPGTVTHGSALPNTRYIYKISGTLTDGRKACGGAEATTPPELTVTPLIPTVSIPLSGWVDLHTHLMSHLAFGGKLFHGAPDVGSLLPAVQMPSDPACRFDARARSLEEALSDDAPTHGDPFQSKCGNSFRKIVIRASEKGEEGQPGHRLGSPIFNMWPKWNDISHQKMWVDWISRAKDGGLRVLVALSHNNRLLGHAVSGGACQWAPLTCVTDDMQSSDLQIVEMKAFVNRHPDLMEVALGSADVYRIVQSNRIAVVLGVEIDNIGNFNQLPQGALNETIIQSEILRLYNQGVRYIFPIHLIDNVFGDTAIFQLEMAASNLYETGPWKVECALPPAPPFPGDEIGFHLPGSSPLGDLLLTTFPHAPLPIPPGCPQTGHRNGRTPTGLTLFGELAVKAMMKLGMIIDIDHMSHKATERVLQIAEDIPGGGYPLMSGHAGIRNHSGDHFFSSERSRTRPQLQRIARLHGMFGLTTREADAYDWAKQYIDATNELFKAFNPTSQCPNKLPFEPGSVALGTDVNSLIKSPRPTAGPDLKSGSPIRTGLYIQPGFPTKKSQSGSKVWDYNVEGVAHYGMYADFVKDVRSAKQQDLGCMSGADLVDNHLMKSANYFWHTWQKIEAQKSKVR